MPTAAWWERVKVIVIATPWGRLVAPRLQAGSNPASRRLFRMGE